MEYIKAVLETLKLSIKDRFILSLFGILVLLAIPFEGTLHLEWFYRKFTWLIVLLTMFFIATLVGDFFESKQRELEEKRVSEQAQAKKHEEQLRYKAYVLGLEGRKKAMVYAMYQNDMHRNYLSIYDSDVLDLLGHEVILPTSKRQIVAHFGKTTVENKEIQELYILAPRVVQIIEESQL